MKLIDTQLVLLSAASQRGDHGIVLPENLKGAAARKVIVKLLDAGLIEEVPKVGELPEWRRDDDHGPVALVVTAAGLKAIGVDPEQEMAGGDPKKPSRQPPHRGVRKPRVPSSKGNDAPAGRGGAVGNVFQPRKGSKTAQLVGLLRRRNGASIEEMTATLHWLPHTTRAAITGLRNRGFAVERQRSAKGLATYRITGEPPQSQSAGNAAARKAGR